MTAALPSAVSCPPVREFDVDYFDRVVLINLKRRPDRLAVFRERMKARGWPFRPPILFEAVDGSIGKPAGFTGPPGAWGCLESHRAVLRQALSAGVERLLVLEDDATWRPDLGEEVAGFVSAVENTCGAWDVLMLGGQHMGGAEVRRYGVVRCLNTQRTHAYAATPTGMRALLAAWERAKSHLDHASGPALADLRAYAPDEFLFGQLADRSDITSRPERERWWNGRQRKDGAE